MSTSMTLDEYYNAIWDNLCYLVDVRTLPVSVDLQDKLLVERHNQNTCTSIITTGTQNR